MRHSTTMHSSAWFTQSPTVANGYSDLFTSVFGGPGEHARSAVCVAGLPDGRPCPYPTSHPWTAPVLPTALPTPKVGHSGTPSPDSPTHHKSIWIATGKASHVVQKRPKSAEAQWETCFRLSGSSLDRFYASPGQGANGLGSRKLVKTNLTGF